MLSGSNGSIEVNQENPERPEPVVTDQLNTIECVKCRVMVDNSRNLCHRPGICLSCPRCATTFTCDEETQRNDSHGSVHTNLPELDFVPNGQNGSRSAHNGATEISGSQQNATPPGSPHNLSDMTEDNIPTTQPRSSIPWCTSKFAARGGVTLGCWKNFRTAMHNRGDVRGTLYDFAVRGRPHWDYKTHFGKCGQSCGCCRFDHTEQAPFGVCLICLFCAMNSKIYGNIYNLSGETMIFSKVILPGKLQDLNLEIQVLIMEFVGDWRGDMEKHVRVIVVMAMLLKHQLGSED